MIIGTRGLGLTPMHKDPSNGDAGFPEASWMADVQRDVYRSYWIRLFPNPNSLGHLTRMRKRGPWRCDVAVWTGQGKLKPTRVGPTRMEPVSYFHFSTPKSDAGAFFFLVPENMRSTKY